MGSRISCFATILCLTLPRGTVGAEPGGGRSFAKVGAVHRFQQVLARVEASLVPELVGWDEWRAMVERQRLWIESAATHREFADRVTALFIETGVSHLTYLADDDWRYWLFASDERRGRKDRQFEHVGIVPQKIDGRWFVRGILEGSVAASSGIRVGDELVSVDGEPFDPVRSLRGKSGRPVTIELRRTPTEAIKVELTPVKENVYRAWLKAAIDSVRTIEFEGRKFAYVHAWSLLGGNEFLNLYKLRDAVDGAILDFREGYGGNVLPASSFLYGDWYAKSDGWGKPVVILTSSDGTRSAKEIVALEARARHVATLIGTESAGAVLGSDWAHVGRDALLYVPLNWYPHEGRPVQPDIRVKSNIRYCGGADPQMERAKQELLRLVAKQPTRRPSLLERRNALSRSTDADGPSMPGGKAAMRQIAAARLSAVSGPKVNLALDEPRYPFRGETEQHDVNGDGKLEFVTPPPFEGRPIGILTLDGRKSKAVQLGDRTSAGEIQALMPFRREGRTWWLGIVADREGYWGRRNNIVLWTPKGERSWTTPLPEQVSWQYELAAADLDGDGSMNCIVGINAPRRVRTEGWATHQEDMEGYILILNSSGEVLCRKRLPGPLDRLIASDASEGKKGRIVCSTSRHDTFWYEWTPKAK